MAYNVSKKPYQQLHPSFTPGFHYKNNYHNIGQLRTPYIGKYFGQHGDYGPFGDTIYYTPTNPTYPYPMDYAQNSTQFIPGANSDSPCIQGNFYPATKYIPSDYFVPVTRFPSGKSIKEGYTKLPVTYPPLKYANNFYPFNNYY